MLLTVAFRHRIVESGIDAGFARISALTDGALTEAAFHEALAVCLRAGLIREPVRLPEGALQCHWRLELTAEGVSAASGKPFY